MRGRCVAMDTCARNVKNMERLCRPQLCIIQNMRMNIRRWPMTWETWKACARLAITKSIQRKAGKHGKRGMEDELQRRVGTENKRGWSGAY